MQHVFLNPLSGKVETCNVPDGIPSGPVSLGTGAAYIPVQTTPPLLTANNTSVRVSFIVSFNPAVAGLVPPSPGTVAVVVYRLNNGSQAIRSLATGIPVTGATPVLTGTIVTGDGWQVTLNANGSVELALAQDAVTNRSGSSRMFWSDGDEQVDP